MTKYPGGMVSDGARFSFIERDRQVLIRVLSLSLTYLFYLFIFGLNDDSNINLLLIVNALKMYNNPISFNVYVNEEC